MFGARRSIFRRALVATDVCDLSWDAHGGASLNEEEGPLGSRFPYLVRDYFESCRSDLLLLNRFGFFKFGILPQNILRNPG